MFRAKKFDVRASEIAGYLSKPLEGEDFLVSGPRHIKTPGTVGRFSRFASNGREKILLIADRLMPDLKYDGFILSQEPELDLAFVLREFFATSPIHRVHETAAVSKEARLGRNVMVGAHTVIGADVEVGDNSIILNNAVIHGPVTIGKFCVIKDGAVVGSEGWSFIMDAEGTPFHPPQLGQILIEDMVWVGANSTIERAMVEDTIISKNARIDDLVHIGGGSYIGPKSEITAGTVIASHVVIGQHVVIAPKSVVRENVRIGDNVLVGLGAVVVGDLEAGHVYVGNPARILRPKKI